MLLGDQIRWAAPDSPLSRKSHKSHRGCYSRHPLALLGSHIPLISAKFPNLDLTSSLSPNSTSVSTLSQTSAPINPSLEGRNGFQRALAGTQPLDSTVSLPLPWMKPSPIHGFPVLGKLYNPP